MTFIDRTFNFIIMIHVVDLASIGDRHVIYNSSILRMLSNVYKDVDLCFYSEYQHQNKVKEQFAKYEWKHITYTTLNISFYPKLSLQKIYSLFRNLLYDFKFICSVFRNANKNRDELVFFCTASVVSLITIKIVKLFYKNLLVLNTVHGEVEYLYCYKSTREKYIGNIYKLFFAIPSSNFYYLLLNKISKNILVKNGYVKEFKIIDIDHPYVYKHTEEKFDPLICPVKVGHIGSMGFRKNSHLLYEVAKRCENYIINGKLEFMSIGPIEPNIFSYKNSLVKEITSLNSTSYLTREDYERGLQTINYSVFFFGQDQFIFRASGALLDAINYSKPIIALKHPYLTYLFNIGGDIGFLCNDIDEMIGILKRLAMRDVDLISKYCTQVKNFDALKYKLDINSITRDFNEQLSRLSVKND